MKHNFLVFVSLILMVGCKKPTILVKENHSDLHTYFEQKYPSKLKLEGLKNLIEVEDATHFFVIGDWGRQGYFNQAALGATMNQISMVIEPEFIISTGDNFYDSGVASVNDPLWTYSFEQIYKGNFLQVPWYVTLGNHDYRGNIQAQIDYSDISRRWTLPAPYWYKTESIDDTDVSIEFTFIDTTPFQDDYYKKAKYKDVVSKTDTLAQKKWIIERLSKISDVNWNIVVGHHPMYTGGKRVNDASYTRKHLESLFDENNVDVYFCGHEHDLQHIKPENHNTHHLISGAGSEVRPTKMTTDSLAAVSETGIMVISVTQDELLIQFVNYKGEVKYKTTLTK